MCPRATRGRNAYARQGQSRNRLNARAAAMLGTAGHVQIGYSKQTKTLAIDAAHRIPNAHIRFGTRAGRRVTSVA